MFNYICHSQQNKHTMKLTYNEFNKFLQSIQVTKYSDSISLTYDEQEVVTMFYDNDKLRFEVVLFEGEDDDDEIEFTEEQTDLLVTMIEKEKHEALDTSGAFDWNDRQDQLSLIYN